MRHGQRFAGSLRESRRSLAAHAIAYVPYFPLGGFSPLQSDALQTVAERLDAIPMAVALAWLLQRSPNNLLIPDATTELDTIGH